MNKKAGDIIDGRYEILHVFEGGMAVVYPCIDTKTEKICALKTFKIDEYLKELNIDPEEFLDQYNFETMKEALTWLKLDKHPNIVRAHAFDFLENMPYIFIELVVPDDSGKHTLRDYIFKENIHFEQLLNWAIQFCNGMEHVFESNLGPHRDITPGNILITQDKTLKITDFGLAKLWENIHFSPKFIKYGSNQTSLMQITHEGGGTPPYMAPEQFDGFTDQRSDIYSFGIVLYLTVTKGYYPLAPHTFQAGSDTLEDWEFAHKNLEIEIIDSILFNILEKCLEKKPEDRYQSFRELKNDLEELYKKEIGKEPPKTVKGLELQAGEYNNKGYSYYKLGKKEEGIEFLKEALKKNPKLIPALNNLAGFYYLETDYKTALEYSDQAIKITEADPEAWNIRGGIYKDRKSSDKKYDFKEAISFIDKAISLDPENAIYYLNKGVILRYMNKNKDACRCFKKSMNLRSNYAEAHYQLSISLKNLGRDQEAKTERKIALRINPDYVKVEDEKNEI